MKKIAAITFLSLAFVGFIACKSDSPTDKAANDSQTREEQPIGLSADNSAPETTVTSPEDTTSNLSNTTENNNSKSKPNNTTVSTSNKKTVETKINNGKQEKVTKPINKTTSDATDFKSGSSPEAKVKPAPSGPVTTIPKAPTKPSELAPEKKAPKTDKEAPPFVADKPDHSTWDNLLGKYVASNGNVNYKGIKKDVSILKTYLKNLSENPVQDSWSRNEKMAYWINAYNAFTVKLIVDNYPVASITKLENGKPWDKEWIKLGEKTYSLNNIENDILRPKFKDARIHFAVNCAAKSCPPLLNKAWTAKNLESNFEQQAKAFVNNTSFNKVSGKEIEISKIFEWYAVDFGDIVSYINKYATNKAKPNAKVKYMEYNWELNE